jgi:DNA-binding NarL/FixJ family response regulator
LILELKQENEMTTTMPAWPAMPAQRNSYPRQSAEPDPGRRATDRLDRRTMAHIQSNVSLAQQSLSHDDLALAAEYLSQAAQLLSRVAPVVSSPPSAPQPQPKSDERLNKLSDREREVLKLLAEGKSAPTISQLLHLSVTTVYTYHQRIKVKLNLRDLPSLIRFALDHQLVT